MKAEVSIGIIVLVLGASGVAFLFFTSPAPMRASLGMATPYTEIANPSGFVNTDGISIGELVGKKVILVDFLTYSCINCQRTFPYLNAWYERYQDEGLEIVGIHTPEFAFEKDIDNVRTAMREFGISYPIVLDNDYATWNAYGNRYWPRKYLIDIHGNIVYDHIGEGAYEETEMKIQELLKERAVVLGIDADVNDTLASESVQGADIASQSPETYFGSRRNEYLTNGTAGRSGVQSLSLPASFATNRLYLGGSWDIQDEYAESVSDARVIYRYSAREVYIVADADHPIELDVFQDDVLMRTIVIEESKLYTLISNEMPGEHTLELRIKGSGARLYAFTFG